MATPGPVQVMRGEIGGVRWELAERAPDARLRPFIRTLQGYVERANAPVLRREFGSAQIVVILEFEPRLRVYASGQEQHFSCFPGGFVAGLDDRPTLTEHAGLQHGVQLNLYPLGARRVFGLPLSELRSRVVPFSELVPSERHLCAELAELRTWDARFARVERFVRARLNDAPQTDRTVQWALDRLAATSGQLRLAALARELGYSHKHVIARFHDQVGVPPKLWAQLLRFERLRAELQRGGRHSWAELAVRCGYYDQAHLAREVRRFTGATPSALLQPTAAFQPALG
jgi:AraC-like DNA-binding protein